MKVALSMLPAHKETEVQRKGLILLWAGFDF
jgi:hypothetical protein